MLKKQRLLENLHIPLWIIKDTCWMMGFKLAGTIMVWPTLLMACYIAWISKGNLLSLLPNLAVLCWISANAIWMLDEFYEFGFKWLSLSCFSVGILFTIAYFIKQQKWM